MAAPPVPPDRHLPMPRPAPSTTYYNGPPPGFHPTSFLPGEVGTTYGPTNPAPPPYPGWMSPADLMAEAQKEAQAFYGPLLAELHRQQTQLHNHNLAQQAAIQGVFQAIQGGLSGPYAQMAGNEGQLGFLGAVQDANQSEQDMAFKVMQLAQEASGKQGDFLGALQDQQASLAGDYQKAHTPTIHGSLTTGLYATYPDGTIKILRPPPQKATAAPKLSAHMVNGQLVWFDPTTGRPVTDPYGTKPAPKVPAITWKTINGQLVGLDAHGNIVKTYGDKTAPGDGDLGPYIRNRRTGQLQLKPGYTYGPGGQIVSTTVPKKVPVKIIGPGGVPLTNSDITQISGGVIADINHFKSLLFHGKATPAGLSELINHFKSQLIPNAIWMPILTRLFRVPTDFSRANLRNMSVSRLHNTAMVLAPNDFAAALQAGPQRVVNGKTVRGFAKNELIDFIVSHVGAWTPKASAAAETAAGFGGRLVSFARQQLGQPYVWGGESRKEGGFDCSGLVDWALRQEGYKGPRVTTYTLREMGQHITRANLQPGDLIITHNGKHVVIYAGDNKVIAAPHTGATVQYQPLSRFTINEIRRVGVGTPTARTMSAGGGRVPTAQRSLAQKFGTQFGVDPLLLLAIGGHETEWGTTGAGRQGYTLGYGATDSGTISKYRGVRNQYYWAAKLLASWGVHTLQDILAGKASRYAIDPGWEQGVASVYNSLANTV